MRGEHNQMIGEQPVHTAGDYQGTTVFGVHSTSEAAALQVNATGDWSITIAPMSGARSLPTSGAGIGDAVFLYDGDLRALTAVHEASGAFRVSAYTEDPHATAELFTHVGPYQGTTTVRTAPAVIAVQSTGGWSLLLH